MALLDGFRRNRKDTAEPEAQHHAEPATAPVAEATTAGDAGESATLAATLPAEIEPEPADGASAPAGRDDQDLHDDVVGILKTVYDPEIPVDIYELGLIYEVDVRQGDVVYVQMTLTSPMCPVAESLPIEVEAKVRSVAGVADVELELVWDPPWNMDMMSEAAKLELNML